MALKLANNASSKLATPISTTDTTIVLTAGGGNLFPTLAAGDWFPLTLLKAGGVLEITRCTGRSGDTLTVERAQEGTTGQSFVVGDRAELRVTALVMNEIADATNENASALSALSSTVTSVSEALESSIDDLGETVSEQNSAIEANSEAIVALQGMIPTGFGPIPWSRPNLPDGGWVWADGGILLSSTPHTALRAAYIADGFPHGQDGSGNPRVPDMRGVVPAGRDNLGGTAAGRLTGATTLGALVGSESVTLTLAQIPSHTHGTTGNSISASGGGDLYLRGGSGAVQGGPAGGGGSHPNVQPTRVLNYIVKA